MSVEKSSIGLKQWNKITNKSQLPNDEPHIYYKSIPVIKKLLSNRDKYPKVGFICDNHFDFFIHEEIMNNMKYCMQLMDEIRPDHYLLKISMVDSIIKTSNDYQKMQLDEKSIEQLSASARKNTYPVNSIYKPLNINFYKGEQWIVPYEQPRSSKTYIYSNDRQIANYDFDSFIGKYMYFIQFIRGFAYIDNKYKNSILGYDNCHDCALDAHILEEYCKKTNNTFTNVFQKINKILGNNLLVYMHGYLDNYTDEPNTEYLNKVFSKSNIRILQL